MSLGVILFDKELKAVTVMYSSQKGADLFVRAKGLVASFNESATRVEGGASAFDGQKSSHFALDPASTDITLVSGDKLTVPFTYEEVSNLLIEAQKKNGCVNFRKDNWVKLKSSV